MPSPSHIPELLAPAGGMDALRAAVSGGADAVYLGLDAFNARQSAENFTLETLQEALRFAHLRGVRVYLTMNVVILPEEIDSALQLIDQAWAAGVDAVIIQDLGLLSLVRQLMPDVRIHASTQMNVHSTASALFLVGLGVSRVTLARELSLNEIRNIARAVSDAGGEVENFAHGALCMCYSGQCLLSSMIGGRSANRGSCAQPCRLPYQLIDEAGRDLGAVGAHLLSPKDLAGITVLPQLIATGTSALKLEGRMKSAEYVALVTGVYRAALDRAASRAEDYEVRDGEMSVLSEAFSRGFTEAYLLEERGNDMMSYSRPNNRGVLVGRVAGPTQSGVASVDLGMAVDADDTIEVWTSRGRFAQQMGEMQVNGVAAQHAPAGARVQARLSEQVSQGDRVFRVRNAALSAAARRLYEDKHGEKIALRFSASVVIGKPLAVAVEDAAELAGRFTGANVESAKTRAVTVADISEHLGRLGGTPFSASAYDIELSPGAGVAFSDLHAARREALANYEARVLAPWSGRKAIGPVVRKSKSRKGRDVHVTLVASVGSMESARACLEAGADEVHLPAFAFDGSETVPDEVVPVASRVLHDAEMKQAHDLLQDVGRGVASTLGTMHDLAGRNVRLQAHWSLNAVNAYTVGELAGHGAGCVWLSPELTLAQVEDIARESAVPLGVAVSGRQELMVTEHCILMAEGPCSENCVTCARRRGSTFLKDRKGYRFPVTTDPRGRSHLYNAVPLDVTHELPRIVAAGVGMVRVDADIESTDGAVEMVRDARRSLDAALRGKGTTKTKRETTSGHFFRGVGQ